MIHHKTLHFPIAFVLLGAVFGLLVLVVKREQLEAYVGLLVWLGIVSLAVAVGAGLWVEDSFGDARIPTHRNWGLAALGASLLATLCHLLRGRGIWLLRARGLFLALAAAFVVFAGELGGEMGHGEDAPPPTRDARGKPLPRQGDDKEDEPIRLPPPGRIVLPPPGRIGPKRRSVPRPVGRRPTKR